MKRRHLPLSKVVTVRQVADLLDFDGPHRIQKARRWLVRNGIARQAQHKNGTHRGTNIYTTVGDIGSLGCESLMAELYRNGVSE